ncbi:two-component system response regulator (stage 0 sporulation protein F) [Ureibacillus xyleni]|uniref:Two-component system response regulator (Stage 0 sporulation protein F) n=1 Tax=Ureibacillus xyleni TaxID=614648 RepID=A0A285R7S3_9BACL|nr:response regulator [Ureibacillus xyleni]SOB89934.1 two-component system response regulator (stage 0 sporulation protein F) [Ureibacillus xyleni]
MRKILIVDDQRGIRLLLEEVFSREGYEVYQAINGLEALSIIKNNSIDCVLLDMKIPGMNGFEILQEIRSLNFTMPIFMMTAFGDQELMDEAKSLGVVKYFTKPFNIFEVTKEVNEVLAAS